MAFTMRAVKVPLNSASLDEARGRVFDFFKTTCRSIPKIMDVYNLYDVVTVSELRVTVAEEIRKNAQINNPKVIDMMLIKATEDLAILAVDPSHSNPAPNIETIVYKTDSGLSVASFLANLDVKDAKTVSFNENSYLIPAWSVSILPDCKNVALNTAKINSMSVLPNYIHLPITMFQVQSLGHGLHVFVNGEQARTKFGNNSNTKVLVQLPIKLNQGKNMIDLLSLTAGLQNYEAYFDTTSAGITGPVVLKSSAGTSTLDLSFQTWTYQIGLKVEELKLGSGGAFSSQWDSSPLPKN